MSKSRPDNPTIPLRLDLLCIMLLPLPTAAAALILNWPLLPSVERVVQCISLAVLTAGLTLETGTLRDFKQKGCRDNGLSSAWLTAGLIILGIIARSLSWPALIHPPLRVPAFCAGLVLYPGGILLRFLSRRQLGRHFSYSIRVLAEHRLITTGIYSHIRHPAYLGTVFALSGLALLYGVFSMLGATCLCIPFFMKRITAEERLLSDVFKTEFDEWKAGTGRLLPRRTS